MPTASARARAGPGHVVEAGQHVAAFGSRPPQRPCAVRQFGNRGRREGQGRRVRWGPCLCAAAAKTGTRATGSGYGHVNALATPIRIAGELGIDSSRLPEAARALGTSQDGQVTPAGAVFRTAGEALGRGIAAMLNIANPGNLLLLLPPELAQPAEGTAAAHYTQAIEQALDKECFSTAAADARAGRAVLKIEPMSLDDLREARPARVAVLDTFIARARGVNAESLAETTVAGLR